MSDKYEIVITNPPYMGHRGMNNSLSIYLKDNYADSKTDFFAVFMEKCKYYSKINGFYSLITQPSWLFLSTFNKLRENIIENNCIYSLLHMGRGIFGIDFGSSSFVIRNLNEKRYNGSYFRLHQRVFQFVDVDDIGELYLKAKDDLYYKFDFSQYVKNSIEVIDNPDELLNIRELLTQDEQRIKYISKQIDFKSIPNSPIAYWTSLKIRNIFERSKMLGDIAEPRQGMATADNNKFLRFWNEVNYRKIGFGFKEKEEAYKSKLKWFPYNKGGDYRKWYGNNEYVVNWEYDGKEIKSYKPSVIRNPSYYFKKCITWSFVSSKNLGARYCDYGFLFDVGGSSVFPNENLIFYLTSLLCSKLTMEFLKIQNPTMNFQVGNISNIPVILIEDIEKFNLVNNITKECISIEKSEWDSFETSWDFQQHPLLTNSALKNDFNYNNIKTAFHRWIDYTDEQFNQLKKNEEELNRIFIDIYGLQDELTPEVDDKDITIRKADRERDIKSLLSYAVGCLFGRYSLDEEGLIYAGGEFDVSRYEKLIPTTDNVLVIADDDYFEDDIVNRSLEFIKITFGQDSLEENLDYIAETLGQKNGETSRQTIRRYFLKDFYNDHVKMYQKRPIYWQFDSGKQNGFKALIYMHRYDSSTVARVRIDYLHKLQKKYEAELKRLDILLESDLSPRDAVVAKKKKDSISKQIQECLAYDQVIAHVANQKIEIDLDDGVAVNYEKFQNVEVPQGEGKKPLKANLLAKI